MSRQYYWNGETLVEVRGGCHMSGNPIGVLSELGLAENQIAITPQINFKDVYVNDFGPNIPADVLIMLSSVRINMTLINYDPEVLDICVAESMGNSQLNRVQIQDLQPIEAGGEVLGPVGASFAEYIGGTLAPAGQYLGGLKRIFESGWHYVSVNLSSTVAQKPWTFPKCYLTQFPVKIPIGNELSKVEMEWTAIPYFDPYVAGESGFGSPKNGNPPYPYQMSGNVSTYTLRGDTPSSGSILWTRVRDVPDSLIPMND